MCLACCTACSAAAVMFGRAVSSSGLPTDHSHRRPARNSLTLDNPTVPAPGLPSFMTNNGVAFGPPLHAVYTHHDTPPLCCRPINLLGLDKSKREYTKTRTMDPETERLLQQHWALLPHSPTLTAIITRPSSLLRPFPQHNESNRNKKGASGGRRGGQ